MIENDYFVLEPIGKVHPGEILLEYLEANCWNQRDLARRTGITPKTINEICNSKAPITASNFTSVRKGISSSSSFLAQSSASV